MDEYTAYITAARRMFNDSPGTGKTGEVRAIRHRNQRVDLHVWPERGVWVPGWVFISDADAVKDRLLHGTGE